MLLSLPLDLLVTVIVSLTDSYSNWHFYCCTSAAVIVSKATDVAPLSVDNEINTVAIANANTNSQTDDNLQVWKSRDCAACHIGQCVCWTRCSISIKYSVWRWCNWCDTSSIIVITRSVLFCIYYFVFTISFYFMHSINLSGYLAASVQIKPVEV